MGIGGLRREWWARRIHVRAGAPSEGTRWTYLLGDRITFYRFVFDGKHQWSSFYLSTKRLSVNITRQRRTRTGGSGLPRDTA